MNMREIANELRATADRLDGVQDGLLSITPKNVTEAEMKLRAATSPEEYISIEPKMNWYREGRFECEWSIYTEKAGHNRAKTLDEAVNACLKKLGVIKDPPQTVAETLSAIISKTDHAACDDAEPVIQL